MRTPNGNTPLLYLMQGLDASDSYLNAIRWVLRLPALSGCILTSAYADSRGVGLVLEDLQEVSDVASVYLGVNNGSTTYEAVCDLVEGGIKTIGIDTASRETIFHQKAFLSWNSELIRMVIGSANLTHHGLLQNYEGGLLLECELKNDYCLRDQIIDSLGTLRTQYPDNFIAFNEETLESNRALLLSQEDRIQRKQRQEGAHSRENKNPPMRPVVEQDIGYQWPKKLSEQDGALAVEPSRFQEEALLGKTSIWTQVISRRHISLKGSPDTHITGDFNLGKGNNPGLVSSKNLDFQTYYRYDLFSQLDWTINPKTRKEEADAWFNVIIDGEDIGSYRLTITFTQSIKTVREKNTTTAIRWGKELLSIVSNSYYLGGTISLYVSELDDNVFLIEISSKQDV